MFKLVISDDEGKTTVVPLIRDEVTIGRKEGNTIRLTDRNVSRTHACLKRRDEDTFTVEDTSSRNGTKVNGELIENKSRRVSPGDQITIGDYNLSIRTDVATNVPMGRQMDPGDSTGIGKITPHARLVMLSIPKPGQEFDLTVDLYVVGRSDEANLRIPDPSISRAHARLDGDEHRWTISDLDSVSGILINGIKRDDYLLKSGDIVELGTVRLRFVAPGEPYEYQSEEEGALTTKLTAKSNKLFYILGAIAAAAIVAIVTLVIMTGGGSQDTVDGNPEDDSSDELSFEELIEAGKDNMQVEEWAEAARFFARAILLKPNDEVAKKLKRKANSEMEAQAALVAGLAAGEAMDWQKAVKAFSSIPRSSHYYDLEQLQQMSAKLCEELLVKAKFIAESGTPQDALEVLAEIGGIPEAPKTCKEQKEQLRLELDLELERKPPSAGGSGGVGGGTQDTPSSVKPLEDNPFKPVNPYSSSSAAQPSTAGSASGSASSGSGSQSASSAAGTNPWDPVGDARTALQAGDVQKAIKILENGGKSRAVLALLARLYLQTGNKTAYEKLARQFIKLYPTDPKSSEFKQNLGIY